MTLLTCDYYPHFLLDTIYYLQKQLSLSINMFRSDLKE